MTSTGLRLPRRQQGVILVVSLIFVLLLSLGAIAVSRGTILSERIAGNQWEQDRAYQAAEAGLVDGMDWLFAAADVDPPEGDDSGSEGVWATGTMLENISDPTYDWSDGRLYGTDTDAATDIFSDSHARPRYLVENVGWVSDDLSPEHTSAGRATFYYSVSSVGYGQGESARSVLQTIAAKRYR